MPSILLASRASAPAVRPGECCRVCARPRRAPTGGGGRCKAADASLRRVCRDPSLRGAGPQGRARCAGPGGAFSANAVETAVAVPNITGCERFGERRSRFGAGAARYFGARGLGVFWGAVARDSGAGIAENTRFGARDPGCSFASLAPVAPWGPGYRRDFSLCFGAWAWLSSPWLGKRAYGDADCPAVPKSVGGEWFHERKRRFGVGAASSFGARGSRAFAASGASAADISNPWLAAPQSTGLTRELLSSLREAVAINAEQGDVALQSVRPGLQAAYPTSTTQRRVSSELRPAAVHRPAHTPVRRVLLAR